MVIMCLICSVFYYCFKYVLKHIWSIAEIFLKLNYKVYHSFCCFTHSHIILWFKDRKKSRLSRVHWFFLITFLFLFFYLFFKLELYYYYYYYILYYFFFNTVTGIWAGMSFSNLFSKYMQLCSQLKNSQRSNREIISQKYSWNLQALNLPYVSQCEVALLLTK